MQPRFFLALPFILAAINSCSAPDLTNGNSDRIVNDLFQGIYLVDDVFFPQDTLVLHKFQLSDTSTTEMLMVHFKNDSIYLSNYNFNSWYGKWFCKFQNAKCTFENDALKIDAQVYSRFHCYNDSVWQKISYKIMDSTENSMYLIKTLDTSNCEQNSVLRHLSREGRDFDDVQLR